MKVLVIGSAGMLGHTLTIYLRKRGYTVTDISRTRRIDSKTKLMNVLESQFEDEVLKGQFDVIINCAALLVQASEKDKTQAIRLNAWFPHQLSELLKCTSTKIIHVSSSGVFSGENTPYFEYSICNPVSFYGKTKSLGELNNNKDLTIRVDVVGPDLSKNGVGLFNWFVKQQGEVLGYSQTFFNGVTSLECAKFIEYAITNQVNGIYHLGASETISKSEFLKLVKEVFGLNKIVIKDKDNKKTDHTLLSLRTDIDYEAKTYVYMLQELKEWMEENAHLYTHYKFM